MNRLMMMTLCLAWIGCPDDTTSPDAGAVTDAGVIADAGDDPDAGPGEDAGPSPADAGPLPEAGQAWLTQLPHSTFGSPRLMAGSNPPQLILPMGNEAENLSEQTEDQLGGSITRHDAVTGEILSRFRWERELFTVPQPIEIPGHDDVYVVAGREASLIAVDVVRGELVWNFEPWGDPAYEQAIFNFYQPRLVADQNGDGVQDLIVVNGGDHQIPAFEDRRPSSLMVIDGSNGTILQRMMMPVSRESYFGLTIWERPEGEFVVFGTGGETHAGAFYMAPLSGIVEGDLNAQELVPAVGDRGFIAPPSYADFDNDGWADLAIVAFDGRAMVLSGQSAEPLWLVAPERPMETSGSPAIGDFDGDGDLDIAFTVMEGRFPFWTATEIRVLDGQTGTEIYSRRHEGLIGPCSPLAADVDADGIDEVLLAEADVSRGQANMGTSFRVLHAEEPAWDMIDFVPGLGAGAGLVGDLDGDGYIEWVYSLSQGFVGSFVRYSFAAPAPERVSWGGYFGTDHNGHY